MGKLLLSDVDNLILPIGLTADDNILTINISKNHYNIDTIVNNSIDNLDVSSIPVGHLYLVRESDVSYDEKRLRTWYIKNIVSGKAFPLVKYFSDCIKFLPQCTYSIEYGKLFHAIKPESFHIMRVGSGFVLFPPQIITILSSFNDKEKTEFLDNYVSKADRTNTVNVCSCLDYRFEDYTFFSANFY